MRGILQPNALPSNVIYPSVTSVYSIVDAFSKSIKECVSGEIAICGKSITKVGFVLFFFKKENIVSPPCKNYIIEMLHFNDILLSQYDSEVMPYGIVKYCAIGPK